MRDLRKECCTGLLRLEICFSLLNGAAVSQLDWVLGGYMSCEDVCDFVSASSMRPGFSDLVIGSKVLLWEPGVRRPPDGASCFGRLGVVTAALREVRLSSLRKRQAVQGGQKGALAEVLEVRVLP